MRARRKPIKPPEVLPVYQTLFKAKWIPQRNGGFLLGYEKYKYGVNLVRPILLEEIKPKLLIYRKSIYGKEEYYPMFFYPEASWFSIEEEFKTGRLYLENKIEDEQEDKREEQGTSV